MDIGLEYAYHRLTMHRREKTSAGAFGISSLVVRSIRVRLCIAYVHERECHVYITYAKITRIIAQTHVFLSMHCVIAHNEHINCIYIVHLVAVYA